MSASSTISKRVKEEEQSNGEDENSRAEQEEALVALIEHRTKEVEHLRQRISYYKSQLDQAEKRLQDSQSKFARLQGRHSTASSNASLATKSVKVERRSISPESIIGGFKNQPQSRTELVIPSVNPKIPQPLKPAGSGAKTTIGLEASAASNRAVKVKAEKSHRSSTDVEVVEVKDRGTKRKFEQKEHKELIPLVRSSSSPTTIGSYTSNHIPSQHKRKLRSLAVCPVNDQLFVTSALDGLVNLWQIQGRGSSASFLSTTDCVSSGERRWPEDIAWHPHGNTLFSVYTADAGDSQISMLNLNKTQGRARVTYLENKPHVKGIINSIIFMPWENTCFVTGGSDHAVVLWNERDENVWKPKFLHRNLHSSAVMGVAGMQQKQIVLSAGADKRIIGFDVDVGRADFKHQIESKCMSVLPNPCDFNLFMVQTGAHEKQLRLYDIRLRHTELHSFGWKQESSDSQSALINQAWSPDGLYLSSGSADPVIHIFDIRYNARKPSQSIRAHQKRVFKAITRPVKCWIHVNWCGTLGNGTQRLRSFKFSEVHVVKKKARPLPAQHHGPQATLRSMGYFSLARVFSSLLYTFIVHTPNKTPASKSYSEVRNQQVKEIDEHDQEQLSGFIFMCNGRTKPQCYTYRVFGLPVGKLEVVEKIKPGMKLFLFDFELKLLYGIYEATSVGTLHLEQTAFNGSFPAQVSFKIYRDCLPLHESSFRHAIEYNYQKGFKFKQELNKQQVGSLLSLFRPLTVPAPGSLQPMLLQAVQNQSGLSFPKDSCAQILESQQVQQTGLQQGMGHVHPVDPNVTGLQLSYVQPVAEPQNILQSVPSPQQHYFGSTTNMGHSHPTMVTQVLLASNYQYYLADVPQPYAAGNPTQTVPDQYNSYGTMDINQQLGIGNMYQLPSQRQETVQQQKSIIQYYNSNPSLASPHVTRSVLSYMPTMRVPEVANRTLPPAYLHPFAGAAPTHH